MTSDTLTSRLTRFAAGAPDKAAIGRTLEILEERFALSRKVTDEPETLAILKQFFDRLSDAYGRLSRLKGKRVLDIACGSLTSRLPVRDSRVQVLAGPGDPAPSEVVYTALFEPWLCRILETLGAQPVGIDAGELDGESFEHYRVDLGLAGALDFLPAHSFDAVHDSRLFGSPELTDRFTEHGKIAAIAREIAAQEQRLLKVGGLVIHSDARGLI